MGKIRKWGIRFIGAIVFAGGLFYGYLQWHSYGQPYSLAELEFVIQKEEDWAQLANSTPKYPKAQTRAMAQKYFQMYIDERPSRLANKAGREAFFFWRLAPELEPVQTAIKQIPYSSSLWEEAMPALGKAKYHAWLKKNTKASAFSCRLVDDKV